MSVIQPILEEVAQRTRSIADAEQAILGQFSPSAHRLKSLFTWFFLLIFFGVGLFLLYHALQTTATQRAAQAQFRQTSGTVVQMVQKTTGRRLWAPIVTYQVGGKPYSFESEMASSPPAYQVGEEVVVEYDPVQPQKGSIKEFWITWLPLLLFGGFGSLCTLVSSLGIIALVRHRHNLTPELVQQTLTLVSTGAISAAEGTQRLTGQLVTSPEKRSSSLGSRLVVGALLIAVIYFSLQSVSTSWRLLLRGQKTDGEVVSLVRNMKRTASAPVVRYAVDGKTYELTGKTYSSPAAYEVGKQVVVLYEPDSPEVGAIQSFSEQWIGPLFGLGLAGFFLFIFLRGKRKPII